MTFQKQRTSASAAGLYAGTLMSYGLAIKHRDHLNLQVVSVCDCAVYPAKTNRDQPRFWPV